MLLSHTTLRTLAIEKHTIDAISPQGRLSGPLALTALLVLTVIGPDHLATLVSLCASKRGWEAFNIGTAWGVGHTLGIMMIVPILMILQSEYGGGATQELWAHVGNYLVGIMMICCGLYFYIFESKYFVKQGDGTYVAKACDCCQFQKSDEAEEGRARSSTSASPAAAAEDDPFLCKPCDRDLRREAPTDTDWPADVPCPSATAGKRFGCGRRNSVHKDAGFTKAFAQSYGAASIKSDSQTETTPPIKARDQTDNAGSAHNVLLNVPHGPGSYWDWIARSRGLESSLVGLLQGFCCPSGLQSMIILTHISRTFSPMATCFFAIAFYAGSALGSGLITFFIAEFAQLGLGALVSPRAAYIGCTAMTMCLGVAWIIMNATGALECLG